MDRNETLDVKSPSTDPCPVLHGPLSRHQTRTRQVLDTRDGKRTSRGLCPYVHVSTCVHMYCTRTYLYGRI